MDFRIGQHNTTTFTAMQNLTGADAASSQTPASGTQKISGGDVTLDESVSFSATSLIGNASIEGVSQSQIDAAMVRDDDLGKALKGAFNFPAPPMPFPAE